MEIQTIALKDDRLYLDNEMRRRVCDDAQSCLHAVENDDSDIAGVAYSLSDLANSCLQAAIQDVTPDHPLAGDRIRWLSAWAMLQEPERAALVIQQNHRGLPGYLHRVAMHGRQNMDRSTTPAPSNRRLVHEAFALSIEAQEASWGIPPHRLAALAGRSLWVASHILFKAGLVRYCDRQLAALAALEWLEMLDPVMGAEALSHFGRRSLDLSVAGVLSQV